MEGIFQIVSSRKNYCNRLFTSGVSNLNPPRKLVSTTHITNLYLPPNGTLNFTDPIISNDLLYFSTRPFQLNHLSICLPIILLHHCEDIFRLCPFLWSLTISTNSIIEFETLLISCQPTTNLRLIYTQPQSLDTLEEAIKISKKYTHEFIEGSGYCLDLKCKFRYQIRKGKASAWIPDVLLQ